MHNIKKLFRSNDISEKKIKGSFGIKFTKREVDNIFNESIKLRRIKHNSGSVIADERGHKEPSNLHRVKTDLDTLVIAGIREKQAEKELKRLGFRG